MLTQKLGMDRSWSEEADLNTGRVELAGTGSNSEAY